MRAARDLPEGEAHVWLRRGDDRGFALQVLGAYCGRDLAEGDMARTALGKPFLRERPFEFSLSRSAGLQALVVSRAAIGIDVERVQELPDLDSLARYCLAEREAGALDRLEPARRADFFLRCWTRKEACLKAMGTGLAVEPRRVDTTRDDGAWRWHEVRILPGWIGAVASAQAMLRVVHRGEAP